MACVLTKADEIGIIRCEHPNYSAQLFFGIVRELEWRVLMNIYVEENEQENLEYVHYCVDRFLAGHQKV
ncbi:hypothetical protein D3C81_2078240 [compost metagenome]